MGVGFLGYGSSLMGLEGSQNKALNSIEHCFSRIITAVSFK